MNSRSATAPDACQNKIRAVGRLVAHPRRTTSQPLPRYLRYLQILQAYFDEAGTLR